MARFTLPRDLYHGKGALEALKTFKGKRAIICVGGGSMKRFGFLDRAEAYLKEAGMEVKIFDGIEPDPSVDTVMRGAQAMRDTLMMQLLIRVNRIAASAPPREEKKLDEKIERTLSYINENLARELTVDALAERVYLSRYHFMRLFKAQTGKTPSEYRKTA